MKTGWYLYQAVSFVIGFFIFAFLLLWAPAILCAIGWTICYGIVDVAKVIESKNDKSEAKKMMIDMSLNCHKCERLNDCQFFKRLEENYKLTSEMKPGYFGEIKVLTANYCKVRPGVEK